LKQNAKKSANALFALFLLKSTNMNRQRLNHIRNIPKTCTVKKKRKSALRFRFKKKKAQTRFLRFLRFLAKSACKLYKIHLIMSLETSLYYKSAKKRTFSKMFSLSCPKIEYQAGSRQNFSKYSVFDADSESVIVFDVGLLVLSV
jgi:hypothetical protein